MDTKLKGDISVVGNGLKVMSLDNGEREEVLGPHLEVLYTRGEWDNERRQKIGRLKNKGSVLCRDQRKD